MSEEAKEVEAIPITKYLGVFLAVYSCLIIVVQLAIHFAKIDFDSSTGTGILVSAGLATMFRFVADNQRPPNKSEKRKLIWLSIASSVVFSFVIGYLAIYLTGGQEVLNGVKQELSKLPAAAWIGIIFSLTLVEYVVLRLIYGWGD